MGLFTWGMLPKSQTDPEKIEEAINRIKKAHNENPEAHLGPGQSLQSHKASEIIDHLVASIIADKIRTGEILEKHRHSTSSWKRLLSAWPFEATKIIRKVWTGEVGQNQCMALAFDGYYIYAGLFGLPLRVIKIDPNTMTTVRVWTGHATERPLSSLTFDGEYIYAGIDWSPARVIKIDPNTMTTVGVWTGAGEESDVYSLTCDGPHIYVGLRMPGPTPPPAKVIKVNTDTMTTVGVWTGAAGELICRTLTFDGEYIYAGLHVSPARVIKIDPATMTTVGVWIGAAAERWCRSSVFDGNHIYVGLDEVPAKVVQIDRNEMQTINVWTGRHGDNLPYTLIFDGTYICLGLYVSPARVIKISPVTMATVDTWIGATGDGFCTSMIFDGIFAFFGLYDSPARVIRRIIEERQARAKTVRKIVPLRSETAFVSVTATAYSTQSGLITFNKGMYPNLRSIRFACHISPASTGATAFAILRNLTGAADIAGSEVTSTATSFFDLTTYRISGDIKDDIPWGENILAFRIRTSSATIAARYISCCLIVEHQVVA